MKTQQHKSTNTSYSKRSAARAVADHKPPKDFGVPTPEQYIKLVTEYIGSLSSRKREKCLISQDVFDAIWDVLQNPSESRIRTPQFRFWVRKMFKLASLPGKASSEDDDDVAQVILHESRPVAVKEQIYDILSYYHVLIGHAGRDRTMAEIKKNYSWVPKELVARYVRVCPTCNFKKTGIARSMSASDSTESVSFTVPRVLRSSPSDDFEEGTISSSYSQAVSLASSEEDYFPAPQVSTSPYLAPARPTQTLASLMESRILPTPVLSPLLRSPPIGSPNLSADPRKWLADLAMQPGPSFSVGTSHKFPPLAIRRTASEAGADPIRAPSTRITLPPLMKTLSENMAVPGVHRPAFNVPSAFAIPRRFTYGNVLEDIEMSDSSSQHFDSSEDLSGEEYSNIDPSLLGHALPVVKEYDSKSYQRGSTAGPSAPFSVFHPPASLRQSVIVAADVDIRFPPLQQSDSKDSVSSLTSGVRSVHSQSSNSSVKSLRRTANGLEKRCGEVKESESFDAQDWESTYVLEEV